MTMGQPVGSVGPSSLRCWLARMISPFTAKELPGKSFPDLSEAKTFTNVRQMR